MRLESVPAMENFSTTALFYTGSWGTTQILGLWQGSTRRRTSQYFNAWRHYAFKGIPNFLQLNKKY